MRLYECHFYSGMALSGFDYHGRLISILYMEGSVGINESHIFYNACEKRPPVRENFFPVLTFSHETNEIVTLPQENSLSTKHFKILTQQIVN